MSSYKFKIKQYLDQDLERDKLDGTLNNVIEAIIQMTDNFKNPDPEAIKYESTLFGKHSSELMGALPEDSAIKQNHLLELRTIAFQKQKEEEMQRKKDEKEKKYQGFIKLAKEALESKDYDLSLENLKLAHELKPSDDCAKDIEKVNALIIEKEKEIEKTSQEEKQKQESELKMSQEKQDFLRALGGSEVVRRKLLELGVPPELLQKNGRAIDFEFNGIKFKATCPMFWEYHVVGNENIDTANN
jgi:hypothetical protein